VTGCSDSSVRIWDLEEGDNEYGTKGHSSRVSAIKISMGGQSAFTISADEEPESEILEWCPWIGSRDQSLPDHRQSAFAVTPDGKKLISAYFRIQYWERENVEWTRRAETSSSESWIRDLDITHDGHHMIAGDLLGAVNIWDVRSGSLFQRKAHRRGVEAVAATSDGRRGITVGGPAVLLWDLQRGLSRNLLGHAADVKFLAVTEDGLRAVTSDWDGALFVWDLESGEGHGLVRNQDEKAFVMALSPAGRLAATSGYDGVVRVWDLDTGESRALCQHTHVVNFLAFMPDVRYVVSHCADGSMRVWELETGEQVARLFTGSSLSAIATAGTASIIAGFENGAVEFFSMEHRGHWPSDDRIRVVRPCRLWHFGETFDSPGHWADSITFCCPWCGERAEADESDLDILRLEGWPLPQYAVCPFCQQLIRLLTPIVDGASPANVEK
jgi:WD40 repeat protein